MQRTRALALLTVLLLVAGACSKGVRPDSEAAPGEAGKSGEATRPARPLPVPESGAEAQQLPPGHPTVGSGGLVPPPPGSGTGDKAMAWTVPAGWRSEQPSNGMRKAQYRVPGPGGDGECVVFYFGPGQGGDPMSNAMRWAGQFTKPDGSPAQDAVKTSSTKVGNVTVLRVEVAGTYDGGMTMSMAPAEAKPNYKLLGAVAEGPDANWFFKFTGPEATVESQRAAFDAMLQSLRSGA
jgi:hypothetical protein